MEYLAIKVRIVTLSSQLNRIFLIEDMNLRNFELGKIKLELEILRDNIKNVPPLKYPSLPNLDRDK